MLCALHQPTAYEVVVTS